MIGDLLVQIGLRLSIKWCADKLLHSFNVNVLLPLWWLFFYRVAILRASYGCRKEERMGSGLLSPQGQTGARCTFSYTCQKCLSTVQKGSSWLCLYCYIIVKVGRVARKVSKTLNPKWYTYQRVPILLVLPSSYSTEKEKTNSLRFYDGPTSSYGWPQLPLLSVHNVHFG